MTINGNFSIYSVIFTYFSAYKSSFITNIDVDHQCLEEVVFVQKNMVMVIRTNILIKCFYGNSRIIVT